MTPEPTTTIKDIEAMGFTIGIAHGGVEAEEVALQNAEAEASPQVVTAAASSLTQDTLEDLGNAGQLPTTDAERQALAERILKAALEVVNGIATAKVKFHRDALEIAKAMPDVWHVDQSVALEDGSMSVVSIYVSCKADGTGWDDDAQLILDALAHQRSYDERAFQAQNPDAMAAAAQLQAGGATVDREAGSETFTVDGKSLDADAVVALAEEAS